jgi:MYXO-CTERM domain-containing protein
MSSQRRFHSSTALDSGGVLVAGGLDSMANQIGTADVFDPKTGTFVPVPGGLHVPRRWHSATKRKDGTVLLVGGDSTQFQGVAGTELYDPAKNSFSDGPPLGAARKRHLGALLPDGSVVVLAGSDGIGKFVLGGEIVDAQLSAWKPLPGAYQARVEVAGDVIGGGYVLVVAGYGPLPGTTTGTKDWTATTEIYRPETMSFIQGPSLAQARSNHTVTVLEDGRVLVVGGDDGPLASAEIYAGSSLGGACATTLDCTSGFCVDGVCCDKACTGQCEACDGAKKGTCGPVTGTPHGARAVCGGSGTCAGACDGKSAAACTFPDPKTPCASSCDAAKGTASVAFCDGVGECGSPNPIACAPYACGDKACKTTCTAVTDCVTGFVCTGGKCVPPTTKCVDDHTTQVNGASVDCAPYKCGADGTCREACASSSDCATGFACASSGHCERPAAAAPAEGSSGGCATTRQPANGSLVWLGLVGLVVAARRRRRATP